ncbi:MAG: hypothetical protein AAF974_09845 [Cyanobacteria bacterium P01_E01_bin.34]
MLGTSKLLLLSLSAALFWGLLISAAAAQTVEELLTHPATAGGTQTVDELRFAVEESVDGGDYELAIEQLALLIAQLDNPSERAEYVQYRESLIAMYAELSEFERLHIRMSGAGRQLAAIQLGGEAAYEEAIAGGIPVDDTAPLVNTCETELEYRMGFRHPLRMTSQPWVIAIDEGLYNISGVISGPEWGSITGRWRYHCLVHHGDRGIRVLRAESW